MFYHILKPSEYWKSQNLIILCVLYIFQHVYTVNNQSANKTAIFFSHDVGYVKKTFQLNCDQDFIPREVGLSPDWRMEK